MEYNGIIAIRHADFVLVLTKKKISRLSIKLKD